MSELDVERLRRALLEIPYDEDAQYDYSAHGAEQLAKAVVARLAESGPSDGLAAALGDLEQRVLDFAEPMGSEDPIYWRGKEAGLRLAAAVIHERAAAKDPE
jgi:hypothetical protein